ncbi:MAG: ABC transporter permease [Verrucomicrobiota bacterium]
MKLPFSLFLSLRYLQPKRTFLSLITGLSVLGVVLGVITLTVVIAIMAGFTQEMREAILGSESHLLISRDKGKPIEDWAPLEETLKQAEGVIDVQPYVSGQAVLDHASRVLVVEVLGVEPIPLVGSAAEPDPIAWPPIFDKLAQLIPEDEFRNYGKLDLQGERVMVDRLLADGMGIAVGDTLVLHSIANGRELLNAQNENREPRDLIVPVEAEVTGIFEPKRGDLELRTVYVPLELAQRLYNLTGSVSGFDLQLAEPYRVQRVQRTLRETIGDYRVLSWIDRNRAIFDAVAVERLNMYVLLFMIMVVAGFCITNTMITVTTQKRGEIGLMKAVGGTKVQIVNAFLWQGFVVGFLGTVTGLLAAFLILLFRKGIIEVLAWATGQDLLTSSDMMFLYELPAKLTILDVTLISGGAFFFCAVSSLLPAVFAAELDPAKALRQENGL